MDIKSPAKKIVMITGVGEYPVMVYNYLIENGLEINRLIIEEPINPKIFIKRRIKKLGIINVAGQVLNRLFIVPILKINATKRLEEIIKLGQLDTTPPKNGIVSIVPSANSKECIQLLQNTDPAVVVIVNTRILNKRTLSSITGKFINIHAGITPKYRGWHGGYWALVNKDKENCGVTIHLVDEGIDTGGILYQDIIDPAPNDNYYTYPFVQLLTGLPLLKKGVEDVLTNNLNPKKSHQTSDDDVYYHPTIWEYLWNRVFKKVK
jgi:hypothetical protein